MKEIRNKATNNRIVSNISWSMAEKILTELVNSVITLLLARFLLPEDYGVVGLVQVFINISTILVTCSLGPALVQDKDADEEQMSTIFYINFIYGLFLYLIIFIISPFVASYYNNLEITKVLRVLGIKIPVSSIYDIQHSRVKKRMEFKKFFLSSFIGTVLAGIIGVYMAIKGYGVWSLVISSIIDQVFDCIVLFFSTKWVPKLVFKPKNCLSIIKFGQQMLAVEFIGRVYQQFRTLVIGKKYTSADLAYNQKGQKITNTFIDLVLSSVVRVIRPLLSSVQDDEEEMKSIVSKCVKMSVYVITPVMAGIIATCDTFIPLLLTESWIGCSPYMKIYCLSTIFSSSNYVDKYIIEAKGEGKKLIKLQALYVVLEIMAVVIATSLFDNPIYLAASVIITGTISFLVYGKITGQLINYGIMSHIKDSFSTIAISLAMMGSVYFAGLLIKGLLAKLLVQIIVGIAMYFMLSIITKNEAFIIMINYIGSIRNGH